MHCFGALAAPSPASCKMAAPARAGAQPAAGRGCTGKGPPRSSWGRWGERPGGREEGRGEGGRAEGAGRVMGRRDPVRGRRAGWRGRRRGGDWLGAGRRWHRGGRRAGRVLGEVRRRGGRGPGGEAVWGEMGEGRSGERRRGRKRQRGHPGQEGREAYPPPPRPLRWPQAPPPPSGAPGCLSVACTLPGGEETRSPSP